MRPHAAQSIQTLIWASDLVIGRIIELGPHEAQCAFLRSGGRNTASLARVHLLTDLIPEHEPRESKYEEGKGEGRDYLTPGQHITPCS